MAAEIKWKNGSRVKTPATAAHKELERIRKKNGGALDAVAVVEASRSKRAVLHKEFEWDDAVAAEEHRRERARYLMRHIVVVVEDLDDKEIDAPAYVAERRKDDMRSYAPLEDVMSDPDRRAVMLHEALATLLRFRVKYRHLQELAIVFRAHDELLEQMGERT